MWLMPFLHAAFCFGHGAFAVWSCGVLKSSCGVSLSVMGRFAAVPGGRASSLPDSPLRGHVAPPIFTFYFPLTLTGFDWNFVETASVACALGVTWDVGFASRHSKKVFLRGRRPSCQGSSDSLA